MSLIRREPPPSYQAVNQSTPPTYTTLHPQDEENNNTPLKRQQQNMELTSIYEEEEENGLFGGISLFYFLIYSGFSSLLPFLSIILYHHGYAVSQIGTIYTVVFLTSCISSSVLSVINDRSDNKHNIMLLSAIAWIVGYAPLFLIKHKDPIKHCVVTSQNETTNFSKLISFGEQNSTVSHAISSLDVWKKADYQFMILIVILGLGRLLQSGTDYFYFDHNRLLYPENIVQKLTTTSHHISTKVSAAVITVFVGHVLDSIVFCNPSLGHFQMAFYIFLVFVAFSVFVLYFLDVDFFQRPSFCGNDEEPTQQIVTCPLVFKIILAGCTVLMGGSRGVYYAFLQIRLASVDALYVQIGAAFAVHKITETCIKLFRKKLCTKLGIYETFIIVLSMEAIRALYFSYLKSRLFAWFLLPLEMLSGFPALLFTTHSYINSTTVYIGNNGLVSEKLFFVCYWCIGFSFGPIIFGFGYDMWSADYMFRGLALVNLVFALLLVVTYFASSALVTDSNQDEEIELNERTESKGDISDFLLTDEEEEQEVERK